LHQCDLLQIPYKGLLQLSGFAIELDIPWRVFMKMVSSFLLALFASLSAWAGINPDTVLFGHEATFQDQAIVNEPGRMTMETAH
jgi:hypothetical protein